MLDGFRHSFELSRLQRKLRQNAKGYDKAIKEARKQKKPADKIDELNYDWSESAAELDDAILLAHSRYLIGTARSLLVQTPDYKVPQSPWDPPNPWEESRFTGKNRLSEIAQANLKKAIRQERKDRAEQVLLWVPFMSLLIGLMGVAVAALAIIYRH